MKISTRIFFSLGFVFALAALLTMILVRDELQRQALSEAEDKAQIILNNQAALFDYLTQELRPRLFKLTEPFRPADYFDPTWMSATYALRVVDQRFKSISSHGYLEKMATVGARNPVNEADEYERNFIRELNGDPLLVKKTEVEILDGQPYFLFLRRGWDMDETCLMCHGDPRDAPVGLVKYYGSEAGFNRDIDKAHTAVSIRIPLNETYAEAENFSIRLSGLFLSILASLFLIQHLLQKRLLFNPLQKIRVKALQIAASDRHLGERIDPPGGRELSELTEAFNIMSEGLKIRVIEREAAEDALHKAHSLLEKRVERRTSELSLAYEKLKLEIEEKNRAEEALIHERDFVESVINTAHAIILVLDSEGRIVRFNPYLEELSGYRLDEVSGMDWFDTFLHPSDRKRLRKVFLMPTRPVRGYVNRILTKEGQERQIEWYNENLNGLDGNRVGILSIGQDITERKKAEEALKLSEARLRTLYSQQLTAQEEERREIAKEVHDSIGSPLAGLKIGLENVLMQTQKARMKRTDPDSLRALADLAQHAMRECRRIMTDLRPSVLDDYGIVATIGWFCDRLQTVNPGISIEKKILVTEKEVPESLRIVLFRIVQEALNNAVRHSWAENITVSLLRYNDSLELSVRDDGCGFDLKSVLGRKDPEGGIGISNMMERTELSGGIFRIESKPAEGATVFARWSF